MNFTEAVKTCFAKYATFTGRARRSEHWYFFLFVTLIQIVLYSWLMTKVMGPMMEYIQSGGDPQDQDAVLGIMKGVLTTPPFIGFILFWLITLLPIIAVQIRRMHDTSRSGWWILTYWGGQIMTYIIPLFGSVIALAGAIWFIVLACQDSTPGTNKYGPNPKGIDAIGSAGF